MYLFLSHFSTKNFGQIVKNIFPKLNDIMIGSGKFEAGLWF